MASGKNPFPHYGTIVHGENFIGRQEGLQYIRSRIIDTGDQPPGNISIIGERNTGKSSLVYRAIMDERTKLLEQRILPIWVRIPTYENSTTFLSSIVEVCCNALRDLNCLSPNIEEVWQEMLSHPPERPLFDTIKRFFTIVFNDGQGFRVLLVLDDFDHMEEVFKGSVAKFNQIRDLGSLPLLGTTIVTTSIKTVKDIEIAVTGGSNLDQVCAKYYIGMFNQEDMDEFYSRLASVGIILEDSERARLEYIAGSHPYLLGMIVSELILQSQPSGRPHIEKVIQKKDREIRDYFKGVLRRLGDAENIPILHDIIQNLEIDLEDVEDSYAARCGILVTDLSDKFKIFSEYFKDYLLKYHPIKKDNVATTEAEVVSADTPPHHTPLYKGDTLARRYEIRNVLSFYDRAFFCVYEAYDLNSRRNVIIKEAAFLANRGVLEDISFELAQARYQREVDILREHPHPCIPELFDSLYDDRYIVLSKVHGESLRTRIGKKDLITAEQAITIILHMCDLMHYLCTKYDGFVHRDIKPEHIFLQENGMIYLIDFGLAEHGTAPTEHATGRSEAVKGTFHYAAPEQWNSQADLDERADIFALGATIYEALSGQYAFQYGTDSRFYTGEKLRSPLAFKALRAPVEVPSPFEAVLMKMMEFAAGNRYSSWDELKKALSSLTMANKGE